MSTATSAIGSALITALWALSMVTVFVLGAVLILMYAVACTVAGPLRWCSARWQRSRGLMSVAESAWPR